MPLYGQKQEKGYFSDLRGPNLKMTSTPIIVGLLFNHLRIFCCFHVNIGIFLPFFPRVFSAFGVVVRNYDRASFNFIRNWLIISVSHRLFSSAVCLPFWPLRACLSFHECRFTTHISTRYNDQSSNSIGRNGCIVWNEIICKYARMFAFLDIDKNFSIVQIIVNFWNTSIMCPSIFGQWN